MKKKYSFLTILGLIIGIVIGSGVFFKAKDILDHTKGNLTLGIFAWAFGGIIMIISSLTFANLARKYQNVNGLLDFSDTVNRSYTRILGRYLIYFHNPIMTGILAWVSVLYLGKLFNYQFNNLHTIILSLFLILFSYFFNLFIPKISGYFQISTTYIKLIPILIISIIGIVYGFTKQTDINDNETIRFLIYNFNYNKDFDFKALFKALVAASFAYEGWIVATSVNSELKDAKKQMPKALILGAGIIMILYISYFIGISGASKTVNIMSKGAEISFVQLFGKFSYVINLFVLISCLGTLNGLMMSNIRSSYSLAVRKEGIFYNKLSIINKKFKMPINSSILGLILAIFWFLMFMLLNIIKPQSLFLIKNNLTFDISELPIIFIYAFYFLIYFQIIIKEKTWNIWSRYILPILSIICASIMMVALFYAHISGFPLFLFILYIVYSLSQFTDSKNDNNKLSNLILKIR